MYWIAIALAVVGLLLLLIGFARNGRGTLVLAAIVLFVAGSLGGFLDRWVDTAYQAEAEARALKGLPPARSAPGTLQTPAPMDTPAASPQIAPPATPAPAPATTAPVTTPAPAGTTPAPVPAPSTVPAPTS